MISKKKISLLKKVDLSTFKDKDDSFIETNSWDEWADDTVWTQNHDTIRSGLYFGTQSVLDLLLNFHPLTGPERKSALTLFDFLIKLGRNYFNQFYSGPEKIDLLQYHRDAMPMQTLATEISSNGKGTTTLTYKVGFSKPSSLTYLLTSKNLPFKSKQRYNELESVTASTIQDFVLSALEFYSTHPELEPDYFVYCASSPLESALTLSSFLDKDVGAIRFSKKRGDKSAKVVKEHGPIIRSNCESKHVTVIEDCSHTGIGIQNVADKIKLYGAGKVTGLALELGDSNPLKQKVIYEKHNFTIFEV